jgi:hypothetical protein
MAPNNALSQRKKVVKQGTTTVLDAGTVESRGMGTKATTRSQVSAEITEFLNGEAKLSLLFGLSLLDFQDQHGLITTRAI